MTQQTKRGGHVGDVAGARMAVALHVALRSAITEYRRHLTACGVDPVPEAVHDLRVAIRRILVALDLGCVAPHTARLNRLRKALAVMLKSAGALRDTQVHLELMRERMAEFPACREFYEELERAEAKLKDKFRKSVVAGVHPTKKDFRGLVGKVAARHALSAMRRALTEGTHETMSRLEPLVAGSFAGFHRGRVSARDLRYILEIARPVAEHAVAEHLTGLRAVQDSLGAFHDLECLRARMSDDDSAIATNRKPLAKRLDRDLRVMRQACIRAAKQFVALGPFRLEPASTVPHASVYVLRHAIAKARGTEFPDDRVRPLTKRGKRRMTMIAETISALNLRPDIVLTSPYVRAADTAHILVDALERPVGLRTCPWLAPTVSRAVAVAALSQFIREGKNVVIIGHEPALQELTRRLTGSRKRFDMLKKGGLRKIEFFSPDAGHGGRVAWTLTPKQLMV